MRGYDYSYVDKVCNILSKKFIIQFRKVYGLANFDELNVLSFSLELYKNLLSLVEKYFLAISRKVVEQVGGKKEDFTEDLLLYYLEEYDPITGYVFTREVDRKRARFEESIIATKSYTNVKKALTLWDRMVRQFAIEIADKTAIHEYKKNGVKKVQWITDMDGKECDICHDRHKKIYPIDKIPTKPHINCRCRFIPYE